MGNYCCRNKEQVKAEAWSQELNEVEGPTEKQPSEEEKFNQFIMGAKEPTEEQKKLLPMFETLTKKVLDIGNLSKYIEKKDGKEVLNYQYFVKVMQMVFFWKMMIIDNQPKKEGKNYFQSFRDARRKALFASAEPPKEKTDLADVKFLQKLGPYSQLIMMSGRSEIVLMDQVIQAVGKKIDCSASLFKESQMLYMGANAPQRNHIMALSQLTRNGML